PAVGVIAATTPLGALYCHRIFPVFASSEVMVPAGSPSMLALPRVNSVPGVYSCGADFNSLHQSSAPTISASLLRSNAGLFHSIPPSTPGQISMPAAVGAVKKFFILTTGVL